MATCCVLSQKSSKPCSQRYPAQTLDEIDASNLTIESLGQSQQNRSIKLSWIILSRSGINFLASSDYYGKWLVCFNHRNEFLDSWNVNESCVYPAHQGDFSKDLNHVITLAMAVKVLQKERKVLPIRGRICDTCKEIYNKNYPRSKEQAGNLVVVIPRGVRLMEEGAIVMPSPFLSEQVSPRESAQARVRHEENNGHSTSREPASYDVLNALGVLPRRPFLERISNSSAPGCSSDNPIILTMKTEVLDSEEETVAIKEEAEDLEESQNINATPEEEQHSSSEGFSSENEDEAILSSDSDDDRTWAPPETKKSSSKKRKRPPTQIRIAFKKPKKTAKRNKKALEASDDDSMEKEHICKVCNISFFSAQSYKQHMRSSKKAHKKVRFSDEIDQMKSALECADCKMTFSTKAARAEHRADVHNEVAGFYCSQCDVFMKNESAFKSHNSKLHLERRKKSYYCRECDTTFTCKAEHQAHIVKHLLNDDERCLQCQTCGKVFTSRQDVPYQRHLATHDADIEEECVCDKCTKSSTAKPKKEVRTRNNNLLKEMQHNFEKITSSQTPDDRVKISSFACGMCSLTFTNPNELVCHVVKVHEAEKSQQESASSSGSNEKIKTVKRRVFMVNFSEGNSSQKDKAVSQERYQELVGRNWAAEFGYGKSLAKNKEKPSKDLFEKMRSNFKSIERPASDKQSPKKKTLDLLQKMKSNFHEEKSSGDEEVASDEGEDTPIDLFQTRGFTGKVKASLQKSPRTLSHASLSTRKRLERLIQKARDFQKRSIEKGKKTTKASNDSQNSASKPKPTESRKDKTNDMSSNPLIDEGDKNDNSSTEPTLVSARKVGEIVDDEELESSDDDDDFEGFEDEEDDSLLIPLANGWVCEKKVSRKDSSKLVTLFWSPDGRLFDSLKSIKAYCSKQKVSMDFEVFDRVLKRNAIKVSETTSSSSSSTTTRTA